MALRQDFRRVLDLIRHERRKYTTGLLALFVVNLCDVIGPFFLAVAIDLTAAELAGTTPMTPQLLTLFGLSSTQFTITSAVVSYLMVQLAANVARYPMVVRVAIPSHRVGQLLRNRLVGRLLRLSRSFYDRTKSGTLMSLATADVHAVRMMLGPGILIGIDTLMLVALVLSVMFAVSWKLTLIVLIPLPAIAWITNRLSHLEYDRFEAVQKDLGQLTERARESYAGMRIIQGYAREEYDRERFREHSQRHFDKNMRLARVVSVFDPTLDLMLGASTVLVLIFGGLELVAGAISLGDLVAFFLLVGLLAGPMIGFGWAVSLFQRGRASVHRLDRLEAERVEVDDAPGAVEATGEGAISVRDLTFRYAGPPPEEILDDGREDGAEAAVPEEPAERAPALHGVSLEIPAGTRLGVFGPVGAGKSTLVGLIVRLYDPPPGTVFLDGIDVRNISVASLRRTVVLAPQESFLFSDTVERNVGLAIDGEALEAEGFARIARLHDEVSELPLGYQTMLGERGINLSGGQRQRLAIARAIAADPRVMILDDCLSAVDARTEDEILDNLDTVFAKRTGIIVSHRVRAVERCDRVVVLNEGEIVEIGTHEELMQAGGYYAQTAREQASQSEAAA